MTDTEIGNGECWMSDMFHGAFNQEGPFMAVLYKISDLFLLNILWILFSLPIVSIGASTSALYTVTLKMVRNEESYIFRSFIKAFRQNFKQATILWFLFAAVGGVLYFNLYVAASGKIFAQNFFFIIFTIMTILYLMIGSYLFPVQARFDTNVLRILKISAYLSLRHLGFTIAVLAITILPFLVVALYLYLLPIFIIIAVSGSAFLSSFLFHRIFLRYEKDEKNH